MMLSETNEKKIAFPLGAAVTTTELETHPYSVFKKLAEEEPITWIHDLSMWYVTKHEWVQSILKDSASFTTSSIDSLIFDTFGEHILTVEGEQHQRYKMLLRGAFTKLAVQNSMSDEIKRHTRTLLASFSGSGEADFRSVFASRLPILTMLSLFGFSSAEEHKLRAWYNSFERALSNFERDRSVRNAAKDNVKLFEALIQDGIGRVRRSPNKSLLSELANAPSSERLSDDEIKRNAAIIFFGGISTVEALILNTLWVLGINPEVRARIAGDLSLVSKAIEETVRYCSPVQSATRHATRDIEFEGVSFARGDVINCMLGAANRDPDVFDDPEEFNIDRINVRQHVGFAVGVHHCLGAHLARLEAEIAITSLFQTLPNWQLCEPLQAQPRGYEFHQPDSLNIRWYSGGTDRD